MPLLRSLLFAPGNVARRVEKALSLTADAVIVDLEDSVAISDKEATRKPVASALSMPRKCLGYVRVNAPSSAFCYADLAATIHKRVDGVVLPKVESAAAIRWAGGEIAAFEAAHGRPAGGIAKLEALVGASDRGIDVITAKLAHPEVLQLPDRLEGVRTFDYGEDRH